MIKKTTLVGAMLSASALLAPLNSVMAITHNSSAAHNADGCKNACAKKFDYHVDRFADIEVLRYRVPGFENLSRNQKILVYYLTEAALTGRDILWDQNGRYIFVMVQVI